MEYLIMYATVIYIVTCADADGEHEDNRFWEQRFVRALLWPITVTQWFVTQNSRLHRFLNILWCVLILGWFLSLMADRL